MRLLHPVLFGVRRRSLHPVLFGVRRRSLHPVLFGVVQEVLAVAGGQVRIPTVTDHVEAGRALLADVGIDVDLEPDGETTVVSVPSPLAETW